MWDAYLEVHVSRKNIWLEFLTAALQAHQHMKGFRNAGWPHYDKFQNILPSVARGTNVFHPTQAPPINQSSIINEELVGNDDNGEDSGGDRGNGAGASGNGAGSSGNDAGSGADSSMIVDTDGNARNMDVQSGTVVDPSAISTPGSKRKISAIDDGVSLLSSARNSTPSFLTSGRRSSKMSRSSGSKGVSAAVTSSMDYMEGTMNRLAGAFEQSLLAPPPQSRDQRLDDALVLLQERDDGLGIEAKVAIISHFTSNPVTAHAYMMLKDDEVRRSWLAALARRQI